MCILQLFYKRHICTHFKWGRCSLNLNQNLDTDFMSKNWKEVSIFTKRVENSCRNHFKCAQTLLAYESLGRFIPIYRPFFFLKLTNSNRKFGHQEKSICCIKCERFFCIHRAFRPYSIVQLFFCFSPPFIRPSRKKIPSQCEAWKT